MNVIVNLIPRLVNVMANLIPGQICTYRSAARKNVFVYPYQVSPSSRLLCEMTFLLLVIV